MASANGVKQVSKSGRRAPQRLFTLRITRTPTTRGTPSLTASLRPGSRATCTRVSRVRDRTRGFVVAARLRGFGRGLRGRDRRGHRLVQRTVRANFLQLLVVPQIEPKRRQTDTALLHRSP